MKLKWLIFSFILMLGTTVGYAQTDEVALLKKEIKTLKKNKKYTEAFTISAAAVDRFLQSENWGAANTILYRMATLPDQDTISQKLKKYIDRKRESLSDSHPIQAIHISRYLATRDAYFGRFKDALTHYEKCADQLYERSDTQYLHKIYYYLAQCHLYAKSDGATVQKYAEQAERIFNQKKDRDSSFVARLYYVRGIAFRGSNENKVIENLRKSQELQADRSGEKENIITKALINLKRFDEAYVSAKKASQTFYNSYGDEYGLYQVYEAVALDYLGRNDEALAKIEEGIKNLQKNYDLSSPEFANVYYYKAQILKSLKKEDNALNTCQYIFQMFYPQYIPEQNTDIPEISGETPDHWVLSTFTLFGDIIIQKYQQTKDIKYLEQVMNVFENSINDISIRRYEMDSWESKERYNNYIYNIYQNACITAALLYQADPTEANQEKVLSFLAKSRSTLLQETRLDRLNQENTPDSILQEEIALNKTISEIETKILKAKSAGDQTKTVTLKNDLFDTEQKLKKFKLENQSFYGQKKEVFADNEAVSYIRQLPDDVLNLAYLVSNDEILSVGFSRDEFFIDLSPKNEDFDELIVSLGSYLSDWGNTLRNRSKSEGKINAQAKMLSTILLKPLKQFSSLPKHLVILPNGPLQSIPFELLMLPDSEQRLIEQFDLSYAYLFSSLPKQNQKTKRGASFAGFAPIYQKEDTPDEPQVPSEETNYIALRSGLIDIPRARQSVAALTAQYHGKSWIGTKATKENFVENAQHYDVLHLGMHSLLNENTSALSSLVFSGKEGHELYLREVQSMDIPASLVVLSACNTGVGREVVGEGSFSLARAFFYAGAESTLMSLWQVPDEQTSRIMQLFYDHLNLGLSKSQALASAKRDFLDTASPLETHPAFWSGFVLVGDTSPIHIAEKSSLSLRLGISLLVALFVGFALKYWFVRNKGA